jgi:hypothetical protein
MKVACGRWTKQTGAVRILSRLPSPSRRPERDTELPAKPSHRTFQESMLALFDTNAFARVPLIDTVR